jgi:Glycosyl transferase family 2
MSFASAPNGARQRLSPPADSRDRVYRVSVEPPPKHRGCNPMSALVSIIIPTKDRYATLFPVVDALVKHIQGRDFEIVVQDNSQDPAPAVQFFSRFDLDRVVYRHSVSPLSIVGNTELAIKASSGEFVTFIGDDDLVSPYICEVVHMMREQNIECLTYPPAYYWWSSVTFVAETYFHRPRALWVPKANDCRLTHHEGRREVDYVLENGAVSYFNLPRFYHGIVRRAVLERIRSRTGVYVTGASPDMAFSLALGLSIDRYCHVNFPVSVFGASRGSGGGRTAERRHHGRLEDQPHLPRTTIESWDTKIPRVWSEHTIYPQTAIEVLAAFGIKRNLRYESLYASMLVNEPELAPFVYPLALSFCRQSVGNCVAVGRALARKLSGRLLRTLRARTRAMDSMVHLKSCAFRTTAQ